MPSGLSRHLMRLVPFGSFSGLAALAATGSDPSYLLAGLFGAGAVFSGKRLLDRRANARRELSRQVRENVKELGRVAREDRLAAPQTNRLAALQSGILESWELLPEAYRPLLDEDIFTIVGEVGDAARLARRRALLRRHLESVDRRGISNRIKGLERDLARLPEDSPLRAPFEAALEGRRGELDGYGDILDGISMINAQLESAESLLGNLRGELLAVDNRLSPGSLDPGLQQLKERVAYFRRGLDEVTRSHALVLVLGSELTGPTRAEYELAEELGIPRMVFVKDGRMQRSAREFLERIGATVTYKKFQHPGELEAMVRDSLLRNMAYAFREQRGRPIIASSAPMARALSVPRGVTG